MNFCKSSTALKYGQNLTGAAYCAIGKKIGELWLERILVQPYLLPPVKVSRGQMFFFVAYIPSQSECVILTLLVCIIAVAMTMFCGAVMMAKLLLLIVVVNVVC